jgi:hypothetical protein
MGYRNYSTAVSHIVDSTGQGDFTTIGAALTAATSGQTIFVRPGTYTENITLKAGVNLAAYECDATTPNVIINGKCTFTAAGSVSISGIQLQTNSDFCLAVTGSAASIVYLNNCNINALNNTAISFTTSSSSAAIWLNGCLGNIATTGIAMFSSSSAGSIFLNNVVFHNDGASTTADSISAGTFAANYYYNRHATTISGSAIFGASYCHFNAVSVNSTGLNFTSTGASGTARHCYFGGGTQSAVSIGAGAALTLTYTEVNSSNTNAITGSGSLSYDFISFTGSSAVCNVTTQTRISEQPADIYVLAVLSANVTNTTGDGTNYTIIFDSVTKNFNSAYNNSTGVFTAPQAGYYLFNVAAAITNYTAAHTDGFVKLNTTITNWVGNRFSPGAAGSSANFTSFLMNQIVHMNAGDTASCILFVNGSTKTVTAAGTNAGNQLTYLSIKFITS